MAQVFVVLTHHGWGESSVVEGVYGTKEAAEAALRDAGMIFGKDDEGAEGWYDPDRRFGPRYGDIETHEVKG